MLERRAHAPRRWSSRALVFAFLVTFAVAPAVSQEGAISDAPAAGQVRLGQSLFEGRTRFANGGPSCNACHNVAHSSVMLGGNLARDLTSAHSRFTGPGVEAILANPPFPVMQRAFADRPLTDEEVAGLVAFLQQADREQSALRPVREGVRLFAVGIGGSVLLMGLYAVGWRGRRRDKVNQAIYDRQISST